MSDLLLIVTSGLENPTRACFPFFLARAARQAGKDVAVVLAADSSVLANPQIRSQIQGVGFPSLNELYGFACQEQIPVYI